MTFATVISFVLGAALDIEARNLAAVGAAAGGRDPGSPVVIPRAHHDLSTRRVLVMQRLDGVAVSQADGAVADAALADGDRERLARDLLDCLLRQIVVDGVFHADPHPGNILLLAARGRTAGADRLRLGRPPGLRAARRPAAAAARPGPARPGGADRRPARGDRPA